MVGGGVATFDCNDDGFPDMLLAGGEQPAKFYRNASTRGGPLQFEARAERPRTRQRDRRLSARHRQRRHHRSRAAARRRERRDARPRRLPVRARQRGVGLRRRRRLVDRVRRDLGTRRRLADARDRQLHRPQRGDRRPGAPAPTTGCTGRSRRRQGAAQVRRAAAAEAELLPAVDAVHRLEPVGHAEPARLQRPRILQGRPGAALARRARQAAGPLHRRGRLEAPAHLGHGHRQLRPQRRRLSRTIS